jgi:hypothetical protein
MKSLTRIATTNHNNESFAGFDAYCAALHDECQPATEAELMAFLQYALGNYHLHRANEREIQAMDNLSDDPFNLAAMRALQAAVRYAESQARRARLGFQRLQALQLARFQASRHTKNQAI